MNMMYETWEDFTHKSWEDAVEDAKKRKAIGELEGLLKEEDEEEQESDTE